MGAETVAEMRQRSKEAKGILAERQEPAAFGSRRHVERGSFKIESLGMRIRKATIGKVERCGNRREHRAWEEVSEEFLM
jgi:hypothetical protein